MSAFVLKKIIGKLLMPVPLFFLVLVGAGLLSLAGRPKLARSALYVASAALFALSLPAVSFYLVSNLEYKYHKYNGEHVDFVVVHGGYHKEDDRHPVTSLLSATSLVRLSEGVRLSQLNPNAKLILSGYNVAGGIPHPEAMAKVAEVFGVSQQNVIIVDNVKDTSEEVNAITSIVRQSPFVVVTSAMHMPRTLYWYALSDLFPVTAPTDFHTKGSGEWGSWWGYVPSAQSLRLVELAWHEYLGLLWAWIKG